MTEKMADTPTHSQKQSKEKHKENSNALGDVLRCFPLDDHHYKLPLVPESLTWHQVYVSFLRELYPRSTLPKTDKEFIDQLLMCRSKTKLQCCEQIAQLWRFGMSVELRLPATREQLTTCLQNGQLPAVVRAATTLSPRHGFDTFEEVITTLGQTGHISMHQSGSSPYNPATTGASKDILRKVFILGERPTYPLNFLDVVDFSGFQHKLDEIIRVDLVHRIQMISGKRFETKNGFVILSQTDSISTFHVDKAGANTWITTLCGTKIWFIAGGQNAPPLLFAHNATHTNYDRICRIPLPKGDTLYVQIKNMNAPMFTVSLEFSPPVQFTPCGVQRILLRLAVFSIWLRTLLNLSNGFAIN